MNESHKSGCIVLIHSIRAASRRFEVALLIIQRTLSNARLTPHLMMNFRRNVLTHLFVIYDNSGAHVFSEILIVLHSNNLNNKTEYTRM